MSASELADIEALLLKVLPDPMGYAERLLGELAERLATPAPGASPAGPVPTVIQAYPVPADERLADRCVLLAAALGACDCWGEDPGCEDCSGAGAVGWVPPEPEVYEEYVAPAVRRAATEPTEGSDEGGSR
jgi:hypothetical protein